MHGDLYSEQRKAKQTRTQAKKMIFQTAALASLLGLLSASPLTTEGVTTIATSSKTVKQQAKELLRAKLDIPRSMTAKVERITKKQSKGQTVNLETTTFDESKVNLRGLKMRDNFVTLRIYEDDDCSTLTEEYGGLVNYCFNEKGTESGAKQSYITKVNLKENLLVEIEYDGNDCKVSDKVTNFRSFSHCFYYRVFLLR
jgi:hypothetical protein